MLDSANKYSISSKFFLEETAEQERVKDTTRRRFGQEIIYKLLEYQSPVVISIDECVEDLSMPTWSTGNLPYAEFKIVAKVNPVRFHDVVIENLVYKYIDAELPFLDKLKWLLFGKRK